MINNFKQFKMFTCRWTAKNLLLTERMFSLILEIAFVSSENQQDKRSVRDAANTYK